MYAECDWFHDDWSPQLKALPPLVGRSGVGGVGSAQVVVVMVVVVKEPHRFDADAPSLLLLFFLSWLLGRLGLVTFYLSRVPT